MTNVERVAREMLRTSRPLVAAIRLWLSEDVCDCEMFHRCGKTQREREASEAEAAIAALESALKELEAPAVPTAADSASKRQTFQCSYTNLCDHCGQSLSRHEDQRYCPSAPAVPTAVDLTLARPGDVCRLRNGCQILFEGDNLGIDGDRNTELPFLAGGESYKANGAYLDCETIAGSDIIAVCRDGRLICGVDITSTGDSE